MKKLFLYGGFTVLLVFAGYWGLYFGLRMNMPPFQLRYVEALPIESTENVAPFFEVMSPVLTSAEYYMVPRLVYKKGPPDRYINKFSLSYINKTKPSNRADIIYFGRRSHSSYYLSLADFFANGIGQDYGTLLKASLEYAYNEMWPINLKTSFWQKPFTRIFLLLHAREALLEYSFRHVYLMNHSGSSSFLLDHGKNKYTIWFFKDNKKHQIKFASSKNFQLTNAKEFFQKSFLVNHRTEAISYVSDKLAEIKLQKQQQYQMKDFTWPLSLLIAKVSVDPSSINAYFHFAGLNTLLFKSFHADTNSPLEVVDELRNNVLSASKYAKDVAPESAEAHEISRFARTIVDTF